MAAPQVDRQRGEEETAAEPMTDPGDNQVLPLGAVGTIDRHQCEHYDRSLPPAFEPADRPPLGRQPSRGDVKSVSEAAAKP